MYQRKLDQDWTWINKHLSRFRNEETKEQGQQRVKVDKRLGLG